MRPESRCDTVQSRLSDAFLARGEAARADRDHATGCAACSAHRAALWTLARELSADGPPVASDALVDATLHRATGELARRAAARAAPPEGYSRELFRIVAVTLLPLPLVLLWNAAVLSVGGDLLTGLFPHTLVRLIGGAYVLAGATWLACLYGSLPLFAHRQLRRRALEVAP